MRVIVGEDDDQVLDELITPKCHPVFNHPLIDIDYTFSFQNLECRISVENSWITFTE
ncbi:hypothetical protein S7335_1102 [Synechococcus sp. PCC 7335]|nr:hypothetical protein S7335_1102 [Synechococcus sp. PCC 7335]